MFDKIIGFKFIRLQRVFSKLGKLLHTRPAYPLIRRTARYIGGTKRALRKHALSSSKLESVDGTYSDNKRKQKPPSFRANGTNHRVLSTRQLAHSRMQRRESGLKMGQRVVGSKPRLQTRIYYTETTRAEWNEAAQ